MFVTATRLDFSQLPNGNFIGAVVAPNGKVYSVSNDNINQIWALDTATLTSHFITIPFSLPNNWSRWAKGVLHPNGYIYWPPNTSIYRIVFDPSIESMSVSAHSGPISDGRNKWLAGVLSNDGRIFYAPNGWDRFYIISETGFVSMDSLGLSFGTENRFHAGALGPDGKIYFPPGYGNRVLVVDPSNNSAVLTTMGASIPTHSDGWWAAVTAPNGKIYCVPYRANVFLIIDTFSESVHITDFGLDLSQYGTLKWRDAVLGPDGRIYCFAYESVPFLVIDPESDTAEPTTFGIDLSGVRVSEAVALPDGRLLGLPSYLGASYSNGVILSGFMGSGIYLRDPITDTYYSHPNGQVINRMDFGIIGAGRTTEPKPVTVDNLTGVSIKDLTIEIEAVPSSIAVEVSLTLEPFEPQQLPLVLPGPFDSGYDTITLWVRVSTTSQSPLDQYVVRMNVSATEV